MKYTFTSLRVKSMNRVYEILTSILKLSSLITLFYSKPCEVSLYKGHTAASQKLVGIVVIMSTFFYSIQSGYF